MSPTNNSPTKFIGSFKEYLGKLSVMAILSLSFIACEENNSELIQVEQPKPRVIITLDPECDDQNSLIRFLLHATDFKIEGMIYASSQFHWKGDGKGTTWFVDGREYTRFNLDYEPMESYRWAPDEKFIHDMVDAYEIAYPNLKVHDPNYPTPQFLRSKIKWGNIEFDGDMSKDTEGSNHIKERILADEPGPLFITAWGGASTIARALKSIEDENKDKPQWESLKTTISEKVKLALSGDQDDTYANYIKPFWPDIEVLRPRGGGIGLAYNVQASVKPEYAFYYQPEWIQENIRSKGSLGENFRVWGDGKQMVEGDIFDYFGLDGYTEEELKEMGYVVWTPVQEKGAWLGEGDTGTFLNFLNNGLRAWERQDYGGWAGRHDPKAETYSYSSIGNDSTATALPRRNTIQSDFPEFLPAAQNELAGRFRWAVTPIYEGANHHPIIEAPLQLHGKPGEKIKINAKITDPDQDTFSTKWMQFNVGYKGTVAIDNPKNSSTTVEIPNDTSIGEEIHLILEVTDQGVPALTKYHRVIINVT